MKLFFSCTKPQQVHQPKSPIVVQSLSPAEINQRLKFAFLEIGLGVNAPAPDYAREKSSGSIHSVEQKNTDKKAAKPKKRLN